MTSIEVAGVALGALPILVSSLKQFERAFAPIKSSGSLRREIQFVHIELESQQLILQQTLRVLLNEACSDSELEELLSDPTSSLWRSREIESALVESLGSDAYAILLHMFTRLFDTVSSLEKSLKSITGASINGSLNFRSRLKWILSEDKTRKRLNEVHEQNRRMTEIINLSLYKHQFERRRAIENINSSLVKVLEVQKLAEDVETFTSEASEREQNSEDDRRSTYTVESEVCMLKRFHFSCLT
jgi:hypothetical protein